MTFISNGYLFHCKDKEKELNLMEGKWEKTEQQQKFSPFFFGHFFFLTIFFFSETKKKKTGEP